MAKDIYDQFGLEKSTEVQERNVKILFWGAPSTRKTESVLRYFSHVLLIDAEGNSDQIVDMPEIPPFLRIKTKDQRRVLEILEAVVAGKLLFMDGKPIETISIDSASVIWSVQQEVAYGAAEARALKYHNPLEGANATQRDWSMAKRPLKKLANLMSASPVKFFILIGREADKYSDKDESGTPIPQEKQKKIGFKPDVMKGTEYEVNLALHMQLDPAGKWFMEVTKVQGKLATIFPMGKRFTTFPIAELLKYAEHLTGKGSTEQSENEIADDIVKQEAENEIPHTQKDLIDYAKSKGIDARALGTILKAGGISGFDPKKWPEMKNLLDNAHAEETGPRTD